jgi:hypothetical protein
MDVKEKCAQVTINNFLVKNVLQTYDRQLGTASRIARLNRVLTEAGLGDSVTISPDARRKSLVERIAREIVDNLMVSGSANPVVQEIRRELEAQTGHRLLLTFSPEAGELVIHKQGPDGPARVSQEERASIMETLWTIAMNKVDETML